MRGVGSSVMQTMFLQARLPRVRSLTEKQKMIKRLSALSFKAPVITQQKQPGWQELHKKCVLALAHSDEECAPPSELRIELYQAKLRAGRGHALISPRFPEGALISQWTKRFSAERIMLLPPLQMTRTSENPDSELQLLEFLCC